MDTIQDDFDGICRWCRTAIRTDTRQDDTGSTRCDDAAKDQRRRYHVPEGHVADDESLSDMMDFDCLVLVREGREPQQYGVVYFELVDGELLGAGPEWRLLSGFSGQYGYSGPLMHSSELIGGGLERHIRETPGDYVALVNTDADGEATGEWAVAFREPQEDTDIRDIR